MDVQPATLDQALQRLARTLVLSIGAVVGPRLSMMAYLFVSRSYGWGAEVSDYCFFGLSIGIGLVCIALMPFHPIVRAGLAILYVPIAYTFLLLYALGFVCDNFGDCL
jgi:hypothetical protein